MQRESRKDDCGPTLNSALLAQFAVSHDGKFATLKQLKAFKKIMVKTSWFRIDRFFEPAIASKLSEFEFPQIQLCGRRDQSEGHALREYTEVRLGLIHLDHSQPAPGRPQDNLAACLKRAFLNRTSVQHTEEECEKAFYSLRTLV